MPIIDNTVTIHRNILIPIINDIHSDETFLACTIDGSLNTTVQESVFHQCVFTDKRFVNSEFVNCTFTMCDFNASVFQKTHFRNCTFVQCNFVSISGARIAGQFTECHFRRIDGLIQPIEWEGCLVGCPKDEITTGYCVESVGVTIFRTNDREYIGKDDDRFELFIADSTIPLAVRCEVIKEYLREFTDPTNFLYIDLDKQGIAAESIYRTFCHAVGIEDITHTRPNYLRCYHDDEDGPMMCEIFNDCDAGNDAADDDDDDDWEE